MALGLVMGICRAMRRRRSSSLDILTSKRSPRVYYKGKNCKSTGFHTRKGGYVVMEEKLPHYVVPDLTNFKTGETGEQVVIIMRVFCMALVKLLKPYVAQCSSDAASSETTASLK